MPSSCGVGNTRFVLHSFVRLGIEARYKTLGSSFCYFAVEQRSGTLCENRSLLSKTQKMKNPAERFPVAALRSKVLDDARFEVQLQQDVSHCS